MVLARYQQLVSTLNDINPSGGLGPCTTVCKGLGTVFAAIFSIASWPFAEFAAQAYANKTHDDTWIAPQFNIMLALLWISFQTFAVSVPFQFWLQRSIIKKYKSEGREITAIVVYRKKETNGKGPPSYKVVIIYEPDPFNSYVFYAKKMKVNNEEYERPTLDILVIPEILTSAVLKKNIDRSKSDVCLVTVFIVAVVANLFLLWGFTISINSLLPYNYSWFWAKGGIWVVFSIGWMGSIFLSYAIVNEDVFGMLYGESTPTSLPFHTNVDEDLCPGQIDSLAMFKLV